MRLLRKRPFFTDTLHSNVPLSYCTIKISRNPCHVKQETSSYLVHYLLTFKVLWLSFPPWFTLALPCCLFSIFNTVPLLVISTINVSILTNFLKKKNFSEKSLSISYAFMKKKLLNKNLHVRRDRINDIEIELILNFWLTIFSNYYVWNPQKSFFLLYSKTANFCWYGCIFSG